MPERIGFSKPLHKPKTRTTSERGYGADWRKVRRIAMARSSWMCVDCMAQGRTTAATDGHHVAKIADAPHKRLDVENVMPLCKACHDARTARGE